MASDRPASGAGHCQVDGRRRAQRRQQRREGVRVERGSAQGVAGGKAAVA
jgi:hypothetical protein